MNVDVNYLGVLVAGIVAMVVGFVWYSALFGKTWQKLRGFTEESLKAAQKGVGTSYAVSFVLSLVTGYMMAHVMGLSENFFHYSAMQTGLTTAFFMWLGFVMPTQLTAMLFSDKKSTPLFLIDTGHQLASLIAMGIVLSFF